MPHARYPSDRSSKCSTFAQAPAPCRCILHVRRWRSDGAVASLLVYAPTLGQWFEGDDMPPNVRAFAVHALATYLDHAPVFACAAGMRS